jgi:uncharacterized membrane protein
LGAWDDIRIDDTDYIWFGNIVLITVALLENLYQPKETKLVVSDIIVGHKTTRISGFLLEEDRA